MNVGAAEALTQNVLIANGTSRTNDLRCWKVAIGVTTDIARNIIDNDGTRPSQDTRQEADG
jgi:hypothetical protein